MEKESRKRIGQIVVNVISAILGAIAAVERVLR